MASGSRVSPERAAELVVAGYTLLDVRSEPEFALGHPKGALNVPFQHPSGDRLVDNPEFLPVIQALFSMSTPLLLCCASGTRSALAAQQLSALGYTVTDIECGYSGKRDAFGRLLPGWRQRGLPCESESNAGEHYASLRQRLRSAAGGVLQTEPGGSKGDR